MITLRQLFLRIMLIGCVAIILVGFCLLQQEKERANRQWKTDTIARSAETTSSYYAALLPQFVLNHRDQQKSILDNIKMRENLLSVTVMSQNQLSLQTLSTCQVDYGGQYFYQVPTCYKEGPHSLTIYHELRSAGQSLGYLAKEFPYSNIGLFTRARFVLELSLMLFAFISVSACSLFYLHRYVMQPMSHVIRLLQGNKYLDINPGAFRIAEINAFMKTLKQALHDIETYQGMLKSYEYEAKIGKLTAQVAHDIRSPLSVLKTFIQRYEDESLNRVELTDLREAASRSIIKLQNMAEDLLDHSKAQQIRPKTVNVNTMIKELLQDVSTDASNAKINIRSRGDQSIFANMDQEKINRVLTNILLNGIQAHEKPGFVSLKVDAAEANLVIMIEDDGKGISAENITKIFDNSFTFGKPKGTGLGLSYCKQVIEAHGGTIEVQSVVGKGTAFTIRMPGCVVQDAADHKRTPVGAASPVVALPAGSLNVLIADDDGDLRALWKQIVDEKGGRVIYAASSVEEIITNNKIDYSKIDMAIVDYNYEGSKKNGIELVSFLKQKGVRKVHLCTGLHDHADIHMEAINAGAHSIIAKPLDDDGIALAFA